MRTPMRELIEVLKIHRDKARKKEKQYGLQEVLLPAVIDAGRAIAFEEAISLAEAMLEKEKEMMCQFAFDYNDEFYNNGKVPSIQDYYNETFNTKER